MTKYLILLMILNLIACGQTIQLVPIPGPSGAPGRDGVGIVGLTGPSGSPGQDASGVKTVQFCPGYITSYPNSFPEFGFVIDGKIYATYYDGHNAWTAEIVPGYYASTSTSAPCNFTVNQDGSISQ